MLKYRKKAKTYHLTKYIIKMLFLSHKETSQEMYVVLSYSEVYVCREYRSGHIKSSVIHCFISTYKWLSVPATKFGELTKIPNKKQLIVKFYILYMCAYRYIKVL